MPDVDHYGQLDDPRIMVARIAEMAQLTRRSGRAATEKGRRTFRESFYDATDPDLPENERQRQADAAYRTHMRSIAKRSRGSRPKPAQETGLRA